jgi:hypothetical protein
MSNAIFQDNIVHAVSINRTELNEAIDNGSLEEFIEEQLSIGTANLFEFLYEELEAGNLP